MNTYTDFGIDIPPSARGPEVDTTCPKCSASRRKKYAKCLSVNTDDGIWVCHHCSWAGSLKQGEYQRPERRRWYIKPKVHRLTPLPEKIIAWFQARGIPERVLSDARVGWGSVYFGELEEEAYAIQFPYYRNGELVNVKYRALPKTFRMSTGAERILYGLDDISGNKALIWVEGEMDKLSMEVAGLTACVSVPDGAPDAKSKSYDSKFDFLESAADVLSDIDEHILAVDNDANGRRLEEELARRLGVVKCKRVMWPDGCKDANDVLAKHGADRLARCIAEAEPYPVAGLMPVTAVAREAWDIFEHGLIPGYSTGWKSLDTFYTIKPGQLTIITGIPAHGKSSWLQSMAINLARQKHWRFAMFSPEDQPLGRLVAVLAQRYKVKGIQTEHGPQMAADEFQSALAWLHEHFYFLQPDDQHDATLDGLLELAGIAVLRYGIRGLLLDPWNELEHVRPRDLNETEYISQALGHLRQFARLHDVHVWVVAHPTKLVKDKDGKYPLPSLYDVSGSANWRNKADNGLVIYRPSTNGMDQVEVHVQKVRFREVGKPGMVKLNYHQTSGTFSD